MSTTKATLAEALRHSVPLVGSDRFASGNFRAAAEVSNNHKLLSVSNQYIISAVARPLR
jgi:hypothetical protein